MLKVKFLIIQAGRQVQRMRNILVILVLFVCTSICLGWQQEITISGDIVDHDKVRELEQQLRLEQEKLEQPQQLQRLEKLSQEQRQRRQRRLEKQLDSERKYSDIAGNGNPNKYPDEHKYGKALTDGDGNAIWNNPNNNHLFIKPGAKVGNAFGAKMNAASVDKNKGNKDFLSMTNNEIIVSGGKFDCGDNDGNIAGAWADDSIYDAMKVSSNTVIITGGTDISDVFGGGTKKGTVSSNTVTISNSVTIGENVYGGYIEQNGTATLNKVNLTSVTVSSNVFGANIGKGLASGNTVTITSGTVGLNVYGGYIVNNGTATGNTVNLTRVTVSSDVYGARIESGLASSNTVTINGGTVRNVYGGYILLNGTAILNTVNLTSVTVTNDVYGARIRIDGDASSNTVTINGGTVGMNVYGGYIEHNGTAILNTVNLTGVTATKDVYGAWIGEDGYASSNAVTINGGTVRGNVFGGYVKGNGKAIHNTINITGAKLSSELSSTEFSPESILCGGICADATTNDAVTGNTLNIETKGVVVKGISNFEKYKFNLKDIKPGETVLTATSGGCGWNTDTDDYTPACAVDISRSNMNISLHTQGVLNKGDYYTLIKSPQGFKDNVVETGQCDFENEGLLIKYYWDIKITDDKQDLRATLIDKKIRDGGVARSLSEGYGTGVVCTNNGMDCVLSKIEETESLLGEGAKLQRKEEIGAFYGLAANKSRYNNNKRSHIDITGMSMMVGVGKVVEVDWREQSFKGQSSPELSSELISELTVGVFAEYGTGNSDIHCKKKSKCESKYVGGGLLGSCNIYENEFSETKVYVEAILRAGQVSNSFNGNEIKDSLGKEIKYDMDAMYGGCALGGGYKHKVSEKIDLDWSLRYMFGYQGGKGVKQVDEYGNKVKFESVISNRIRVGVRGKYVELEKVKPYAGIWCEHELSGKVKGEIQNGADIIDIPASSFGGGTGIGEVGVSGKVWKFGVDINGQGYLGVRKGFGGMLKLKYAFGKYAHTTKPQPKDKEKEAAESEGRTSFDKSSEIN